MHLPAHLVARQPLERIRCSLTRASSTLLLALPWPAEASGFGLPSGLRVFGMTTAATFSGPDAATEATTGRSRSAEKRLALMRSS
jgi:hypothetical protein